MGGIDTSYIKIYKNDIKYILLFFILLIYILSKLGFYKNLKNNIYLTEQKALSKKILGNSSDYKILESEISDIYYTDNDSEYVSTIKRMVDTYYPLLLKDFGFESNKTKAIIIIYPNVKELEKAIEYNYNGKTPMGVYYGRVINLLSPQIYISAEDYSDKIDYFLKNGPIIHELSHYLLDVKTKGNFETWFSEGVALYYEYKYTSFEWRKDLKEASKEIKYTDLKSNFRYVNEAMAYRRSFDIINDFVEKYGEEKLQEIISSK